MNTQHFLRFVLSRWLPLLVLALGAAAAGAQQDVDPPARVASLSQIEGSVAFAPAGETEWADAVLNRPITRGDRLWTDRGARAELHLGSAVLHIDSQTFLDLTDLDDDVLQASLNEGTVNARVRELARGENFEIDTPQLAFRASRPGDYRIDVDPSRGTTRVTVRSGAALVYGASGQGQELVGGQVVTFAGTDLERIAVQASLPQDGFDRWAADRNRAEDESIAARYIPRDVVGYHQLDPFGSWAQDASYGAVWYPRVTVTDWAPYRYGHWEFIAPWGWTWIDDAPWGFAPFHYGRWAMIGSRWAWVPGRIGPRPVYAPALVVFVGGGGGVSFSLSIGSGSGIGWFPLAPGEAWRPYYRTSPRYVTSVNRYIVINNQVTNNYYINQRRPSAVTAVAVEDFSRGRPVHRSRRQLDAGELDRVRIAAQPTLPEPRRIVESRPSRTRALPPPTLSAEPVQPRPQVPGPAARRRDGDDQRPIAVPRPQVQEQQQVQREQERAAREQERSRRDQQLQQERTQREQRDQQMQVQRQQDEQRRQQQVQREQERAAREQERAQREQQMQVQRQQQAQREQERAQREQDRARRDQQVQQERAQREQALRENAMRQQQQAQERAQRQQQAAQEQAARQQQAQERAQRQQQAAQEQAQRQQQQRALRQQAQPQVAPTPEAPPAPRERGRAKPERDQRDDNRSPGGEEGGRGRGQGRAG